MDTAIYWKEFDADVETLWRELQEKYDPDGELDCFELIEAAKAGGDL